MNAILVHGMGRTSLSMLVLGSRLRRAGIRTHFFSYWPAWQSYDRCVARLRERIARLPAQEPLILIGHSLGTVLIRATVPMLATPPAACFFLAPPTKACQAAKFFSRFRLYQWLTGNMGQRLADDAFMDRLPVPAVPSRIYVGSIGLPRRLSPFGNENNDGILAWSESTLPEIPMIPVAAPHTTIMLKRDVAEDILRQISSLK